MRRANLAAARVRRGLTQGQMGIRCRISKKTYCSYERGVSTPGLYAALNIADVLGIKTVAELRDVFDLPEGE